MPADSQEQDLQLVEATRQWYSLRTLVFLTASTIIAAALSFVVRENLRRSKYDQRCRETNKRDADKQL